MINIIEQHNPMWNEAVPVPCTYTVLLCIPLHTFLLSSQVLRVSLDKDLNVDVREVLADDGQLLRGSSVACTHGERMLVGTIKNKMLYCDLLAF